MTDYADLELGLHRFEAGAYEVDLRFSLPGSDADVRLGQDTAIIVNLDPAALFAPRHELERRVRRVLEQAAGRPGHIFNLGHGILQHTPVENVRAVVDLVHEYGHMGK